MAEAFQRKGVKLETLLDPAIPTFRFDYQKVQQAVGQPVGQRVEAYAVPRNRRPYGRGLIFGSAEWRKWRPVEERRRFRLHAAKQRGMSVTDTGAGLRQNIIRKSSKILSVWTGIPLVWGWGWRSRKD